MGYPEAEAKKFELTVRILRFLAKKPALKTQIAERCGMSSDTVDRYLKTLAEAGFIDAFPIMKGDAKKMHLGGPQNNSRSLYSLSKKGQEFIRHYEELLILTPQNGSFFKRLI
jgi:predicted transcriptional regulator